jgi:hypothetical protein
MTADTDLIEQGYENALKSVFGIFFSSLSSASAGGTREAAVAAAEEAFKNGVKVARDARDRALKLI